MSTCEKCWSDSHGDPEKYAALIESRVCTPNEQAGGEYAIKCERCKEMSRHMYTGECLNPDCFEASTQEGE